MGGFASTLSLPAAAAPQRAGLDWRQSLMVQADATLHEALRQPSFWLLTLCFTLHALVQAALWAHVLPVSASKPTSPDETLLVLVTVDPAQVAGRLLHVWLGRGWSLQVVGTLVFTGLLLVTSGLGIAAVLAFWRARPP